MNTSAHLLVGLAACGAPGDRARNRAAVAGGLLPDAAIFFMVAWQGWVRGRSENEIFGIDYFDPFWQEIFAVFNSIPLFLVIVALGAIFRSWWVLALGCAAGLHVLADVPLHVDDGHPPFWPFSDWIFVSPYSYWDVRHGARFLAPAEFVLVAGLAIWLWLRHRHAVTRAAVAACVVIEGMLVFGASLIYG